jgi:hypothetical protein
MIRLLLILPFFMTGCSNVEQLKDTELDSIIREADSIYFESHKTMDKHDSISIVADSIKNAQVAEIESNIKVMSTTLVKQKKRSKLAMVLSQIVGKDTIVIHDTIIIQK